MQSKLTYQPMVSNASNASSFHHQDGPLVTQFPSPNQAVSEQLKRQRLEAQEIQNDSDSALEVESLR